MLTQIKWKPALGVICFLGAMQYGWAQIPELIENQIGHTKISTIQVHSFNINSILLNETREILVVLPPSYTKSSVDRRYPITIITDGEYLIPSVSIASNELTRNGQIPESILIGIKNATGLNGKDSDSKRVHDLTPPGLSVSGSGLNEGGDTFLDFIEKELLPASGKHFRSNGRCIFIGVSSGAILATYAAATRSAYDAVISLDAPIHLDNNWLAKKLITKASSPSKPIRYASLEANYGWPDDMWKKLTTAAPSAWNLYREKFKLEGHETMQMIGAYIGLRQIFGDYSRFSNLQTTANVLSYYDDLGGKWGVQVIPPKVVLESLLRNLIAEGRKELAEGVYQRLKFGYGAPPDSNVLISRIKAMIDPISSETVEGLLNTPFPTPKEAHDFVGEWSGSIWMGAHQPGAKNTFLRISIENEKVKGETVHVDEAGVEHAQVWGYMKITSDGMWWGRLNDRQPKGVMLFKGKLSGDTISGMGQFAGIQLDDPPPPLNFSFRRVKPLKSK